MPAMKQNLSIKYISQNGMTSQVLTKPHLFRTYRFTKAGMASQENFKK